MEQKTLRWKWMAAILILLSFKAGPLPAFVNDQGADHVLGQAGFTTKAAADTQNGMQVPGRSAYDPSTRQLFVTDANDHRVLVYDISGGITDGMNAIHVLGQPNFTTNAPVAAQNGMGIPSGVAYDASNHRLFVTDTFYNRVLMYDLTSGTTDGMNATAVLGQSTWTTSAAGLSNNQFTHPKSVTYDSVGQRLFVGDGGNSRVLVFDLSSPPPTFGMTASNPGVLGQVDFNSGLSQPAAQNTIAYPTDAAYDTASRRLYVTDGLNNRALVFDLSSGITNGMNAAGVLGQTDFISHSAATTQNGMHSPTSVSLDSTNQRLFIMDELNNRVLVYDLWGGITNGMNAINVLGQPDFVSNAWATTKNGFNDICAAAVYPSGVIYDSTMDRLLVTDTCNNRVVAISETDLSNTPQACPGSSLVNPIICGTVTAAEDSTIVLPGIPVKLRDGQGKFLATRMTDGSGNFQFSGLSVNGTYYITPVVDRTESANPIQFPVRNLPWIGAMASLQIRGSPGTLQVNTNSPASFVLISTAPYNGTDTPSLSASTGNMFYTTIALADGTASLPVSAGSYYLKCWKTQFSGSVVTYTPGSSVALPNVSPAQTQSVGCP